MQIYKPILFGDITGIKKPQLRGLFVGFTASDIIN